MGSNNQFYPFLDQLFFKELDIMKTHTIFALLFLFASVFNLYQAAPLEEQKEEVPILSAEDLAVHQMIEQLVAKAFDGGKGDLIIDGTQTDEVLDSNGSADVKTQTDEDVNSNGSVDVRVQTHEDVVSKESEDVGIQAEDDIDSNDTENNEKQTDEYIDSNGSKDVGTLKGEK